MAQAGRVIMVLLGLNTINVNAKEQQFNSVEYDLITIIFK